MEEDNEWDSIFTEINEECTTQHQETESNQPMQQHNTKTEGQQQQGPTSRKQLITIVKRQLVDSMLYNTVGHELPWGFLSSQARKFSIHRSTVQRRFKDVLRQMTTGNDIDVRSKKLGKTGRKPTEYSDELLQSVPLYRSQAVRSYVAALKISHGTVQNLKKKGRLRTHTSSNHPALTSNNKVARLKWVLSHLLPADVLGGNPKFLDMQNVVHIDEKWFFLNLETRRFYLLPNEEDQYRCQQSKRFRVKGMFMAMVGKPIFSGDGSVVHDGKYGIFEFAYLHKALKKSKNRPAGTVEIKPTQNVNKFEIRKMLLNHIIPALEVKAIIFGQEYQYSVGQCKASSNSSR